MVPPIAARTRHSIHSLIIAATCIRSLKTYTCSRRSRLHSRFSSRKTVINDTAHVFLISQSSVIPPGTYAFTIANEATALVFDTALSVCGNISCVAIAGDSVICTLHLPQSSLSDTIAEMFYSTLIGDTYTPYIHLAAESTSDQCLAVNGDTVVTLSLAPACPLDSILTTPYSSSLIAIYPNPANGVVTVAYSSVDTEYITISVCDEIGRTCKRRCMRCINRAYIPCNVR